jgi:hypothetical protein
MRSTLCILGILAAVFFVIGLPTYLCGCEKNIQPNCMRFHVKPGQIVGQAFSHHECSECAVYTRTCTGSGTNEHCHRVCSQRTYYQCYNSYGVASYEKNGYNVTCNLIASDGARSNDTAIQSVASDFPIGKQLKVYIDKTTSKCYVENDAKNIAIAGFSFLILTGIVLVSMLVVYIVHCTKKKIPSLTETSSV